MNPHSCDCSSRVNKCCEKFRNSDLKKAHRERIYLEKLGYLQIRILRFLASKRKPLKLSEIAKALGVDVRRVHDSLKKLIRRGLVAKVSHGLYQINSGCENIVNVVARVLSTSISVGRKKVGETKGKLNSKAIADLKEKPSSLQRNFLQFYEPSVSLGLLQINRLLSYVENVKYFDAVADNVVGYRYSSSGVVLYRTRRCEFASIDFLRVLQKVSYFEYSNLYDLCGDRLLGQIVVYYNEKDGFVHVEYRPSRGMVKRLGVEKTIQIAKMESVVALFMLLDSVMRSLSCEERFEFAKAISKYIYSNWGVSVCSTH